MLNRTGRDESEVDTEDEKAMPDLTAEITEEEDFERGAGREEEEEEPYADETFFHEQVTSDEEEDGEQGNERKAHPPLVSANGILQNPPGGNR